MHRASQGRTGHSEYFLRNLQSVTSAAGCATSDCGTRSVPWEPIVRIESVHAVSYMYIHWITVSAHVARYIYIIHGANEVYSITL